VISRVLDGQALIAALEEFQILASRLFEAYLHLVQVELQSAVALAQFPFELISSGQGRLNILHSQLLVHLIGS